jgi:hypothetical protein
VGSRLLLSLPEVRDFKPASGPNFTSGAEAQIVTESRHEVMVDTASESEFVGRGGGS